jgi:hypothetical protein
MFLQDTAVGYQPVIGSINFGALLQVTPTLVPQSEFVVLDLQSSVTLPAPRSPEQTIDMGGVVPLDRVNLVSHQFMTTLNLPLDTPTLAGGATLQPMSGQSSQLYLVLEVTAAPP